MDTSRTNGTGILATEVGRLALFAANAEYTTLSQEAREALKMRVLDTLGCAIGALGGEPTRMVKEQVTEFGGAPLATLIGGGRRRPTGRRSTTASSLATWTSTTATSPPARRATRATTSRRCWPRLSTPTPAGATSSPRSPSPTRCSAG